MYIYSLVPDVKGIILPLWRELRSSTHWWILLEPPVWWDLGCLAMVKLGFCSYRPYPMMMMVLVITGFDENDAAKRHLAADKCANCC